jgi:hypothetical protein
MLMSTPLVPIDEGPNSVRSFVCPDSLWERLVRATAALTYHTGQVVTPSDIIRQGVLYRVEDLEEAQPVGPWKKQK